MAKGRRWIRWARRTLYALTALVLLGFVAEKISRGIVMRPVRALAFKVGIEIPIPEATPEETAMAREMAEKWFADNLKRYPGLAINYRSIPDEENGFLQLWDLPKHETISHEFSDQLSTHDIDREVQKRCIEEHRDIIQKIEQIALIPTRSSHQVYGWDDLEFENEQFGDLEQLEEDINLILNDREAYEKLRAARRPKGEPMRSNHAVKIANLMASIAAESKDEQEALRWIRLSGNLNEHFYDIEAPFLLSETYFTLGELSRKGLIIDTILPALGPDSDIDAWRAEMARMCEFTPARMAKIGRGEWHVSAGYLAFPQFAELEILGVIKDGEKIADAYSKITTQLADAYQKTDSWRNLDAQTYEPENDEEEFIDSFCSVINISWAKGFANARLVSAKALAVMDLLILEKSDVELTAEHTKQITLDPINGKPFVFDPIERTLKPSEDYVHYDYEPIKLPW